MVPPDCIERYDSPLEDNAENTKDPRDRIFASFVLVVTQRTEHPEEVKRDASDP